MAAAEEEEMGGASSTSLHPDLAGASPSLVPFSSSDHRAVGEAEATDGFDGRRRGQVQEVTFFSLRYPGIPFIPPFVLVATIIFILL